MNYSKHSSPALTGTPQMAPNHAAVKTRWLVKPYQLGIGHIRCMRALMIYFSSLPLRPSFLDFRSPHPSHCFETNNMRFELAVVASLLGSFIWAAPGIEGTVFERAHPLVCNANNCLRAVQASNAKPGPSSATADCKSFLRATVTPCPT